MREILVYLRGMALFIAGIVVGTLLIPSLVAQNTGDGAVRLNHVGIAVKDFQASLNFYTKVMGFKYVYALPSPDDKPGTTFLQISRDTFLELALARENQPTGITHIGFITDDGKATLMQLRNAGATVPDLRPPSPTGALVSGLTDLDGIRLELVEHPPGSLMRKAMASWK